MKVREHRGSLSESMATAREIRDRRELVELIREGLRPYSVEVNAEQIHVDPYTYDNRIGWDTYLIWIDGYGVWGMANGPITDETPADPAPQ